MSCSNALIPTRCRTSPRKAMMASVHEAAFNPSHLESRESEYCWNMLSGFHSSDVLKSIRVEPSSIPCCYLNCQSRAVPSCRGIGILGSSAREMDYRCTVVR